jgi:hypothetical protein
MIQAEEENTPRKKVIQRDRAEDNENKNKSIKLSKKAEKGKQRS